VKLWVDNSLIIHQWTSLTSIEPSGKIALAKDEYYEILLAGQSQAASDTTTETFSLKWSSDHHAKSVISSSRLFMSYHISNSPFALNVLPAITCSATSRVYRPALTLTTAGVMASFTVQSKDAFDNIRSLEIEDSSAFGFAILANSSLPKDDTSANRVQPSEDDGGMASYAATSFYTGNGGYQVNYTATKAGVYNVRGQIMQPGGVFGNYFENDDLTDHGTDTLGVLTESKSYQRMDATIDFDWQGGRPVPAPSAGMKKDIGPSYFSARWRGMVKPEFSEVFTFSVAVDDGAKLWINDLLVIDHWYSRCSEVDGTIALMAGTLYPMKLEYKQVVGNASAHLSWSSRSQAKAVVPADALYSNTTTFNLCNQNQSLFVEPAIVCAATSTAEGAGLTGATAGLPAKFTIQSRDEYMNNRKASEAGIRPGSAAYFCDDWAHSGTLLSGGAHTSVLVFLDASTASAVEDYYTGRTLTITSGTGAGQSRIIEDYAGGAKSATLTPPLTVLPDGSSRYSIGNYGGQWSERCDATRTEAFRKGFPEFHVRITPIIEGSQAPYHAAGLIDAALIRTQQGAGITRLSSTEYPGGLTATYYDVAGDDPGTSATYDPGFSSPRFSTWCTTAQSCDRTIDFSHAAAASNFKFTYGEYPEDIGTFGNTGASAEAYLDHESAGWMVDERMVDSEYGVRWAGYVSPTLAGVYTFHAELHHAAATGVDDRVKLWIDNQLVIQQWNSLAVSGKAEGTFYFAAAYPSAYKISMHYKNPTADEGGMTLRWDNLATASTVTAQNALSLTANAFCGAADRDDVCLAAPSITPPHTVSLTSSYGSVSDVEDAYIGQMVRLTFGGQAVSENRYVKDYTARVEGNASATGTTVKTYLNTDASTTDDFYTGHYIHIVAGTGVGEFELITGYTGCDATGCDPRVAAAASASTLICDCSAPAARSADHAAFATATDTTSVYRIYMYRALLDSDTTATAHTTRTTFSLSTGYSLVTYGRADCAEFTGTAQGGGNTTIMSATTAGTATAFPIQSAAALFGGIATQTNLWVAVGTDYFVKSIAVVTTTNPVTNTLTVVAATHNGHTCSDAAPCTVTPRNTMILAADANTLDDFYAAMYIQVISGTCAGQWREIQFSFFNGQYVTIATVMPWSTEGTSEWKGCVQPDASSVYYISKVCTMNTVTLQTVGPRSSLTVQPGFDGEAIMKTAQNNVGVGLQWSPGFYNQLNTQGDNYPYPYQPFDYSCCAALSGQANNDAYNDKLIVITSGTGRGQRRYTMDYAGQTLLLTVYPNWATLPDSTSRYAIYKSRVPTSATSAAPVVPSSRLFPLSSRYEVTYTPTVKGDYQVHASLAQGSGLDATYYDDMELSEPVSSWVEEQVAFNVEDVQQGFGNEEPRSFGDLALSDKQSFSVRWAGLLQLFDDSFDLSPTVFTFEAGIAETDERVKLWVDNSLIIDQWSSLGASAPTGLIELRSAYYYDARIEYKYVEGCTSGTCVASARLQWQPNGGTMADITSANLYRGYDVMGSPMTVDVKPAGTCAAKSIAVPNQAGAGHSLELSTAGLQAEFTITAKDLYGNLRGVGGDNFKVRLTGVDSTSGLVQDMSETIPGTYRVVYTATKSGTYDISVVFGASGINQSPFRMVTQPARRHLARSVPTGGALSLATAGIQASVTITVKDRHDNWQPDPSVVDAGVKFTMTDAVTLQPTSVAQDETVPADIPSYIDKVSYVGPSTNAGMQVATPTALDNPKLVMRYTVTRSGTYSLAIGGSKANDGSVFGAPFDLTIFPNVACASTSTAAGDALSLATAGIGGTFMIQARDQYYNLRGANAGDNFVARVRQFYSSGVSDLLHNNFAGAAVGADVIECGRPGADCGPHNTYSFGFTTTGGRDKPAAIVDMGDGTYSISYQATRSTTNYLWAAFAVPGGLQATYYNADPVSGAAFSAEGANRVVRQDMTVDFSITSATAGAGQQPVSAAWSARWSGMVKPSLSGTYTFHMNAIAVAGTNLNRERVKLWVDNSLIIHQWTSLTSIEPSGKIALAKDEYYEILLAGQSQAASDTTTETFSLKWSSDHHAKSVISSSRLFMSYHISNSPFALNVLPAITCSATSRVYRPALTLTTAGVMASFTVQSKDAFDNIRSLEIEDSSAFGFAILANSSLPKDDTSANRVQPSEDDGGMASYAATSFYTGNGGYQVNYTATKAGVYNVRGQIMQPGGVFGNYFENDDLTDHGTDTLGVLTESKSYQRMDATIDFDWQGGRPVPAPSAGMKKDIGPSYFSARWRGMVKPEFSEVFTFSVAVDDGAKLWINDLLVIDHWYSRCSEVDGTIALMAGTLYPMKLEYKQVVGNASAHLSWSSRSQAKAVVPADALYSNTTTFNLCNQNQSLFVEPAIVCAATSTAEGAGLTGATAGLPAKFTIQSRDEYMNNRKASEAGIRPGSAAYFCDDWAHSGTLLSGGAHTSVLVFLDASTASAVEDYYTGRTLTITSGTGAGQSRIIEDYAGGAKSATLTPPLTVLPDGSSRYSIGNYGGQWSERCDATRTEAFRKGFPEFHVRITPIIEGSQAPYHAAGLIDAALIRTQQGAGITRLSSTEYPGGLTATYYDVAGDDPGTSATYDPGFSSPRFSTWCTTAQSCDRTIDFSHAAAASNFKFTYGEYPEDIGTFGNTGASAEAYLDHESAGWMVDERMVDSEYGVRWAGYVSPTLAGVYTFHAELHHAAATGVDDRVKLWIDNQLVIQQWNSLAVSGKAEGTFYFAAAYPSAYKISMHYKNPTADEGGMTLRWDNLATASTVTAQNALSLTANAFCGAADRDDVCLAAPSITPPHTVSLTSSYGSVSDVEDAYIGQMVRLTFGGQAVSENRYVKDYTARVEGNASATGTTVKTYLNTDASTTDDFYTGHYIHIVAGTGVGEFELITGYTGCDATGCDPRVAAAASASTLICDCSAPAARSADHAAFATATDTTSVYRIYMYRALLDSDTTATAHTTRTTFSLSTGYSLVTYGRADCAEFTGTAQGGGNTTIMSATTAGTATAFPIQSAAALFGGIATQTNLWVAVGTDYFVKSIAVVTTTNPVTNTLTVVAATHNGHTCSDAAPCTVTPRNTMILAADANTLDDFYAAMYIQVISGTCAGQWREIQFSFFNGQYVTIATVMPWSTEGTSEWKGCVQPDASSVYYISKVCTMNTVTLQTVGPRSSLTVQPGFDGEAIMKTAQNNVGVGLQWSPGFYNQLNTQGDNYPYPYQPFDYSCCAALSGQANNDAYNDKLIVITSGTGRGQRRYTMDYAGQTLLLTVYPNWATLPDSTSRYAIYKSRVPTSATSAAPVVPSSRLFPLSSRYEVTYTPTVKGDYQVHASLAQGSGLDATYYDDMELSEPVSSWVEEQVAFNVEDVQQGFGNEEPRSFGDLALSDKQSFSVRWAGLLQLFDDSFDLSPTVFTFEAGIAETDERVKLWVDNSLIIDRWETYDYLSATTFSATIGLRSPYYYDLKMEYKQFAGSAAKAELRWHCGIAGSPCADKVLIPSSNLFQAREISGSPFPPHEVQPAAACAARSTVRGIALSLATAGAMDSFTIQAHDMYDNERGDGGDMFVVRAVPYDSWSMANPYAATRSSKDCIGCPRTVYGTVEDVGDSSYTASFNGTKRGSYKVLASLAKEGGMFATYYESFGGVSKFHRDGQVGDSETDFPVPCVYHDDYRTTYEAGYTGFTENVGAWRGALAGGGTAGDLQVNGMWMGAYQCQNWISGTAQNGFCAQDRSFSAEGEITAAALATGFDFASCVEVTDPTSVAPALQAVTDINTVTLVAGGFEVNELVGMMIYVIDAQTDTTNNGVWSMITANDASDVATVVGFPVLPTSGTGQYRIFDCGAKSTVSAKVACQDASTIMQPLAWIPTPTSTIILDVASSSIDDAYNDFDVKITAGACKGQIRRIISYNGRTRVAAVGTSTGNSLAWTVADGVYSGDVKITLYSGYTNDYFGCPLGPDTTSRYILMKQALAPGSLTHSTHTFAVRWAGFVKPSATTEYTFQTLLSSTTGTPNEERVKLWVDNSLIIDQWSSLTSVRPTGTIAFADGAGKLYDIQLEYARTSLSVETVAPDASAPGLNELPKISLRWKNELTGSDAALSEAYDYHTIASDRLFANYPIPNSRVLDLQVGDTCATVSTVAGNGLTAATAGVEASFTITAKDAFANDRELEEDSFVVHVDGPNAFNINVYPAPSPSNPGTYAVSYIATESGSYDVSVQRATAGGLYGEYFNNMWLLGDPATTAIDEEVDFAWGAGAVAPPTASSLVMTGSDYMSVRWSGMFKPELSETYTFYAGVDNGARIYVDGDLVVDEWEVTEAGEYTATLAASAGLMYELKVEYRHTTGDASATLSYASASIAKRVVPSSRLFHSPMHVFGSPFKSYVAPSMTCGATSHAAGPGLCFATAGHYAAFTIQARDEYQNTRTKWEDTFIVKASHTDHLGRAKAGTVGANVVKGKYNVAYLHTQSGSVNVYASLAVAGGITATYYNGVQATFYSADVGTYYGGLHNPASTRIDTNIAANNFYSKSGGGSCECSNIGAITGAPEIGAGGTTLNACACYATSLVQDQVWGARWSGLIRPTVATTYTYNVVSKSDLVSERVKLWLDNKLVIDQWSSLVATAPSCTFAFPVAMDYYEIDLEYRHMVTTHTTLSAATHLNSATVTLRYKVDGVTSGFTTLGSSNLARSEDIRASPFAVAVKADVTDWSNSMMQGVALTLGTSGAAASFTISSKDAWGNTRTEGGDQYLAHIASVGGTVFEGTVVDATDGTYTVGYTPTAQGAYDIKVYLGSSEKSATLLVEPGATCAATSVITGGALTIATAGYSATFTIQAKDSWKNVRTVDGSEFFVQVTGPGTEKHRNPMRYIGSYSEDPLATSPSTNLGRYTVAYRSTQSGTFSLDVKMASENGLLGVYYRDAEFSNAVYEAASKVDFNWGSTTPAVDALGVLDGFSVAFTGYVKPQYTDTYTFTTKVAGADERVKLWVDDQWIIDQWNSLSSTEPSGTLFVAANALYDIKVQYKDVTDTAEIHLFWESATQGTQVVPTDRLFASATAVEGSPFMATVFPSLTSGTVSTAVGEGLSIATAGVPAKFTIQAKDHLGNIKTTSDDIFVVRARHNQDFTVRNIQGTVTSLAGNAGLYSAEYTPTWKRNHLSCAGAGSTNTCDPVVTVAGGLGFIHDFSDQMAGSNANVYPNVEAPSASRMGAKHKFHDVLVSQAVKGGLMATYYTAVNAEAARTADTSLFAEPGYRTQVVPIVADVLSTGTTLLDAIDDSFGVRYQGFFSPPTAASYTFQAGLQASDGQRARLWIDNKIIIDEWLSLSSTAPSGVIEFITANSYYDIKIDFKMEKAANTDAAGITLQYSYPDETTLTTIPSTRLFQAYDLSFKVADQAGLTATYYDTAPFAGPHKAVQESTVDWSGTSATDRPYPSSVTDGAFSVRWSGFIKPSRADEYTFYTPVHGSSGVGTTQERVRLWIDNALVISAWDTLPTLEPSGTIAFPVANEFYDIEMEYYATAADVGRGVQLMWENQGQARALYGEAEVAATDRVQKGLVRADSLFQARTSSVVQRDDKVEWDTKYYSETSLTLENREAGEAGQWATLNGCPDYDATRSTRYNQCRGQGFRTNEILKVDVAPATVDAGKCTVKDVAGELTLTTAGVTRSFTLTARDFWDNQRDATDDAFIARATLNGADASTPPFHASFVHRDFEWLRDTSNPQEADNAVFDVNGKYEAEYIITRSGQYNLVVQSADVKGNGLYGTYFATNQLSGAAVTQTDSTVNFNWGRGNPTTSTAILAGAFSVRWAGYVKANYTETYTFYTTCDYGVRLYVDKRPLISQWAAAGSEYSGTVAMKAGVFYDLTLEYQTVGEVSYCSLSYGSPSTTKQVIPASELRVEAQTVSSGSVDQYTLPAVASGKTSVINGPGLSIATAGISASFTVMSKDMYGNLRDSCADVMYVRMLPDAPTCTLGGYPYNWFTDLAGDFFTCTSQGKIGLDTVDVSTMTDNVANDNNHAVIGTTDTVGFQKAVPLDTSTLSAACTKDMFTGNRHPFTYVQTRAGSATLYASEVPGGVGSSYAATVGTGLMATYYETSNFGTPTNAYDCITAGAVYGTASCNTGTVAISETLQAAPFSLTNDGIFSARFTGLIRPTAVTTYATFRLSTSTTAGAFDERVKLWVDNSLLIDQWTSLDLAASVSATVAAALLTTDQLYDIKIEYKNVVGGASDGSTLLFEWALGGDTTFSTVPSTNMYPAHTIQGESMRVRVNPNVAFSRECEVYGQGLSVATAGMQATFAIQSKDAYNNARGVGGDLFIVRAFSDGCQVTSNAGGDGIKQTCQPYGPAIRTCGMAAAVGDTCSSDTNPAPEMNDGGDDDGDASIGVQSRKTGGDFRAATAADCPNCPRIVRGDVVDNGDGSFTASLTGTQSGRYTVVTSLVNAGGLASTYYDGDGGGGAVRTIGFTDTGTKYEYGANGVAYRVDATVDWSAAGAAGKPSATLTNGDFAVRWVGFVRPSKAQQYTFHTYLSDESDGAAQTTYERVKLWVDNSIIIQQWTSLASTAPSGTIGFSKGNGYYDISMLYACSSTTEGGTAKCRYQLAWENTASGVPAQDVAKGRIPSTRLFQRYDVPNTGLTCTGSPCILKDSTGEDTFHTTLQIMPGLTCASQSTAVGDALSIGSAGVLATFTIQAKDAYENSREDTSASFTVDLFGSGGSPIYNGGVLGSSPSSNGIYEASFTAENSKNYDLFVKYGSDNVKGSPFTLSMKPTSACGTKSTIQGTGLTAASISPSKSSFTIQARDQYGNSRTQALAAAQDFIVRVVRTSGSGMQGTNGLPPFYGKSAISTSPTVHSTFNTATNDGKYAGYYQVPSTPSPSGYTHYLYGSWLAKGGVTATYYALTTDGQADPTTAHFAAPSDVLTGGTAAATKHLTGGMSATTTTSNAAASPGWGAVGLNGAASDFVIRMSGMYTPNAQTQMYFKGANVATGGNDGDRVKLWIDNKIVIDQWNSLAAVSPTGSYLFDSATGIYDIHAEFLKRLADAASVTYDIEESITALSGYAAIPTTRLYMKEDLSGSPYRVTVST